MSTAASPVGRPAQKRDWAVVIAAVTGWFGLWYLTPGLLGNGVGSLFTDAPEVALLIEIIFALAIAVVLLLIHLQYNRDLFARSRTIRFYALPLIAGIALPLHYDMKLPITLYMCWWIVSVFWQNYLTFGLLQRYLAERLPTWAVLGASAVTFWAGHALFLPDNFAPVRIMPSLAILALGFLMASLRIWLATLHLLLALHLTFYFVFV